MFSVQNIKVEVSYKGNFWITSNFNGLDGDSIPQKLQGDSIPQNLRKKAILPTFIGIEYIVPLVQYVKDEITSNMSGIENGVPPVQQELNEAWMDPEVGDYVSHGLGKTGP